MWWYDSDTATVPIATGNHFTTPVLYNTTTYYLEAHHQDDTLLCISPRSAITVYVIDTTANNSIFETRSSRLKIHPNPAEDYLTIDAEGDDSLWVEIYDARGVLVMKSKTACQIKLDITHLNLGIYFLRATHNDGRHEVIEFVRKR